MQAGLFSSVLTAFAVNSYQLLRPDPQAQTNAILEMIVSQLSSSAAGNNTAKIAGVFLPPPSAVRLNLLWFCSLTCSLLAALGAVLAKQWMVEYPRGAVPSATACERARHRQVRFDGITTWHFLTVIDYLPALIQLAFLLFLIGLCDFLISLDAIVGFGVTILCAIGFILILFSQGAAMIYPSCPFRTPFSTELSKVITAVATKFMNAVFGPKEERHDLWYRPTGWRGYVIKGWKWIRHGHPQRAGIVPRWALNSATLAENEQLNSVNAKALAWLLHWMADEDAVVGTALFIPILPTSDICLPLTDAVPRLCALFQSYFVIDGDMDSLCPKIVPRDGHAEKIKILGRAIHRIILRHPAASQANRATRVIGDLFGDAYLVFPPRNVHVDIHALVCCLFTADPSYHRRYSQAVQEQLFLSLLKMDTMSPFAMTMTLESLCSYLSSRPQHPHLSRDFEIAVLSHLAQILRRLPPIELASAAGLAFKVILDRRLDPDILTRDKVEFLPQNLLLAVAAVARQLQAHVLIHFDQHSLESGLSSIFRVFQHLASDETLEPSFLAVRKEITVCICQLLRMKANSLSMPTIASAVAVLDCYQNEYLPFTPHERMVVLSSIVARFRPGSPGCTDVDVKPMLHLISRLIDIDGDTTVLAPLENAEEIGRSIVDVLRCSSQEEAQLAMLQSFARHAGFWFERSGLLRSFESAGVADAVVRLLSGPLSEADLRLALIVADHLAPSLPVQIIQADPQLIGLESILKRRELEPYTRQLCATVTLRLVQHLSEDYRSQVIARSQFLQLATDMLLEGIEFEDYVIEDWRIMGQSIAETHQEELAVIDFLVALRSAARGCAG
jgi:hypothetical protein